VVSKRAYDHLLYGSVADRPRPTRTRLVNKPVEALRELASAPLADRIAIRPKRSGNGPI
jgi:hypothetical protein